MTARNFEAALALRRRLVAIVAELRALDPDVVDVPRTLTEGLLDDLDRLDRTFKILPADRREA